MDDCVVIALRLADGGGWGGDPLAVLAAPADIVMLTVSYQNFKGEYESELMRLNKAEAPH